MTKVLLVVGFALALTTLGFAAANAGTPSAPERMVIGGQVVAVEYD